MTDTPPLSIKIGDLLAEDVEAIVNPANHPLSPGGGLDGAIHRAAGPELRRECATLGGCATGQAKITQGYDLRARFVIHTVGPRYGQEQGREAGLLAACYRNCLALARDHGIESLAFPAISTGAFGYPPDEAAPIALQAIRDFLDRDAQRGSLLVSIVLASADHDRLYRALL